MKIIALANQKGGVGKTTSTMNIGAGLNKLGKKVLLVDLDPQAHLTYSLGIEAHELDKTIYELLKGEATLEEVLMYRKALAYWERKQLKELVDEVLSSYLKHKKVKPVKREER